MSPRKYTSPSSEKSCSKCGVVYPATEEYFYAKNRRGRRELRSSCRICDDKRYKSYYQQNRERVKERVREYRHEFPEKANPNPEERRLYLKQYYQDNADKIREQSRIYSKEYHKTHPERARISASRRRARKRNFPDTFTVEEWHRALDHFEHRCAVCGRPVGFWHKLAADHWIPLNSPSCPGTIAANIVPLCDGIGGCNEQKGYKMPEIWLTEKYGKRQALLILEQIEEYLCKWG